MRLIPYYAVSFDHPVLGGATAVGATPALAMVSARRLLADRFPQASFDVDVVELNPETFRKAGVAFDAG